MMVHQRPVAAAGQHQSAASRNLGSTEFRADAVLGFGLNAYLDQGPSGYLDCLEIFMAFSKLRFPYCCTSKARYNGHEVPRSTARQVMIH